VVDAGDVKAIIVDVTYRPLFGLPTDVVSAEQEGLAPLSRETE
jgi:hypothetical protein